MLWDESMQTWDVIGFYGQPAGALVTKDGEIVATWSGPIPEDQVLDALDEI